MRTSVLAGLSIVALALAGAPASGALHDFCVNPVTDAGNFWAAAGNLASLNCNGETLLGVDFDDWYRINLAQTTVSSTVTSTLCPLFVKSAPWDPNLELYFLPAGTKVPNLPPLVGEIIQDIPPGVLVDSSTNANGCDSVTFSIPAGAASGRWYIHMDVASGAGFYNLQTTIV